jgi:hypothetical protein
MLFFSRSSFSQLRLAGCLLAGTLLAVSSGCTMCCAPFDCDFGYTGGAWVRDNPSQGRVGSAFEPAGHKVIADEPAEQVPTPAEKPAEETMPMTEPMSTPETDTPAPNSLPPSMISAPKLRRLQPYLPQN